MQLWGIVAGAFLISLMGSKAFIGGGVAIAAGLVTYRLYGRKHYIGQRTPFDSFKEQFLLATVTEHERRITAFHAADFGGKNHLNVKEFQNALLALGFAYSKDDSRAIFHNADTDEDGVIDIDEFFAMFEQLEDENQS